MLFTLTVSNPIENGNSNNLSHARKCKFCTLTVYFTFLLCWKCNVHCWHEVQHLNESKFKLMYERNGNGNVCAVCTGQCESGLQKQAFTNRAIEIRDECEQVREKSHSFDVRNDIFSCDAIYLDMFKSYILSPVRWWWCLPFFVCVCSHLCRMFACLRIAIFFVDLNSFATVQIVDLHCVCVCSECRYIYADSWKG